jgi:TPR repeat protein
MNSIQHATREELSASTQLVADFVKHTLDTITVERLGDPLSEETWQLAFESFTQAAADGSNEAVFRVATLLEAGRGVGRDHFAALQWFTRAAEAGHASSQAMLGCFYEKGTAALEQDMFLALDWYKKGAEGGSMLAQYNLAVAYHQGDCAHYGVEQSRDDAFRWYQISALNDYAPAQFGLAVCYYYGWVPKQAVKVQGAAQAPTPQAHPHPRPHAHERELRRCYLRLQTAQPRSARRSTLGRSGSAAAAALFVRWRRRVGSTTDSAAIGPQEALDA